MFYRDLTNPYRYIIALYGLHSVFYLFLQERFIIKVKVKENCFARNLQKDKLLNC